jgi:hypothetical protein
VGPFAPFPPDGGLTVVPGAPAAPGVVGVPSLPVVALLSIELDPVGAGEQAASVSAPHVKSIASVYVVLLSIFHLPLQRSTD